VALIPGVDGGRPVTLRRQASYALSVAGLVVVALFAVLVTFTVPAASRFSDQIVEVTVVWLIGWLVWLVGVTPRIVVSDAGLVVVGWFVRSDVPWAALRSVTGGRALVLALADGQEIKPSVAGGSMVSTLAKNTTQRRMLAVIQARRPAVPDQASTEVRRKIDLQPIPFLAVLVVLIVVTVIVYQTGH
jgi:hypothetical protein